jgi:EAL domain-containing protein (putative c-di-GMP-specific phosphodiesterase class I)
MKRAPETLEASRKRFPQGTVIFREREPADCAYIIECGRVEISTAVGGEHQVLTHLGPGEMFGEMAVLDGTARSATATALEDTELTLIVDEQLKSRVEAAEPVLRMLLRVILRRFRHEQNLFRHLTDGEPAQQVQIGAIVSPEQGAIDKIRLESALREALSRNELHLNYQPIVHLGTGEITGFEALLRWNHPELGCLPPQEFIQLAEESALIVPIGRWVLEQACQDLIRFQNRHGSNLTMSVNVSGRQFAEPSFLTELSQVIRETGIDPYRLKLEITEGVLMDYRSLPLRWLEQCKSLGTRIALDDFGTGFSSLSYLASFPLDTLKIDRSFVIAMLRDPKSMKIVLAINQLAHGLGLDLVAEGIEEEAQRAELERMSCEYGQGYLFSKALPFIEAMELLRDPVKVTP